MGEKKKTLMVLKADLQCCRCYKKVKKVLCKFPQIQDQVFKEKENLVLITVVCCCPEKLKRKIICKGGGTITCIEIKEPEKPKDEKPKPKDEKPKDEKPKAEKPTDQKQPDTIRTLTTDSDEKKAQGLVVGRPPLKKIVAEKPKPPAVPVPAYPYGYGVVVCCGSCSQGGPCQFGHGYGRPPQYYEYGRPVYDSYGGGYRSGYQVSRCDNYFSDENPTGCRVM
ncbi:protein PYRICULARIA ORYZAE RESISTANCE 21 isoform X4 [Fagus crenata]